MMFTSSLERYRQNLHEGKRIRAESAQLTSPDGMEPGVVIMLGGGVKFVLRADHAVKLADGIVDRIEQHEEPA